MSDTNRTTATATGVQELQAETRPGSLQIRNIFCPVDFSEFSAFSFRYATTLARHFHARIFLEHTMQIPAPLMIGGMEPALLQDVYRAEMKAEEAQLHAMAETVGPGGPEIMRLLDEGDPVANILERIPAQAIDLLVMGTHGHSGFNRLVLGSITEQIIHRSPCPVLAVSRPRQCGFVGSNSTDYPPPRTILLATDFSGCSDRALAYGMRWASEWGGRLVLFHTVETEPAIMQGRVDLFPEYNPAFEQQIARAWGMIGRLVPEATGKNCEVSYEIRHGNPKEEILRVAAEKGADLIVMGARGISEGEHAWGSSSSAVVRAAKFPVLVVREAPD